MKNTPDISDSIIVSKSPVCPACSSPEREGHCSNRDCFRHAVPVPAIQRDKCGECQQVLKDGRCLNSLCFRYRPPDTKPIADPPKPKRLVGADRESPASGGRFPGPPASPVTIDPADTTSRIEEAVEAAAGTVTLKGGDVIGPSAPGETLHFAGLDDQPSEPVSDNPKPGDRDTGLSSPQKDVFWHVVTALQALPRTDAIIVMTAARAYLDMD